MEKIKKVVWQTKSPIVFDSFCRSELVGVPKGGNVYNYLAACALREHFNFSIDKNSVKKNYEPMLSYYLRMAMLLPDADIVIKENYPAALSPVSRKNKNVALIHHIDEVISNQSYKHKWFFQRLMKQLPSMDLVITVSQYWENYLKERGCKNVKTIYNSFDMNEFVLNEADVEDFKRKYELGKKPIIYIGNAHRQKGVYETYNALKKLDVDLVMTGAKNEAADLPVKFLSLNRKEYLLLLKASHVVVLMSKLTEGWNRVAHESLLCRTPVIGSGSGGMGELLQNAGQTVIEDATQIAAKVESLIDSKHQLNENGYNFVKKFDGQYFKSEWLKAIQELSN